MPSTCSLPLPPSSVSSQFYVGMCGVGSVSPLCGCAPGHVSSPRGGPGAGGAVGQTPRGEIAGLGALCPSNAAWLRSLEPELGHPTARHVGEGLPRARSGRRASVRTVTGHVAGEKVGLLSTWQSVPDPAPPGTWNKPCSPPGLTASSALRGGQASWGLATQKPFSSLGLALFERFCLFKTLHLLNNDETFLPNRRIFTDPGLLP